MKFILAAFLSIATYGQLLGTITDAPQHGFAAGFGVGPTTSDFSGIFGYAEKVTNSGTYSFSGLTVVPNIITNLNGTKSLAITPIVHTGVKQIVYQENRFTLAVDGAVGASLPTTQSSAFNFSAIASVDFVFRLNKALHSDPGATNNYIAFEPQFTQLTGNLSGTVVSIGVVWIHGINGK